LASWKSAGVRTKKDIDAVEKAAREAKGEKAQTGFADKAVRTGTKANRFHNYTQRNTDYDSLIARHDALMTESGDKRTTKQDED
jgi:DNA replication protein DnaD